MRPCGRAARRAAPPRPAPGARRRAPADRCPAAPATSSPTPSGTHGSDALGHSATRAALRSTPTPEGRQELLQGVAARAATGWGASMARRMRSLPVSVHGGVHERGLRRFTAPTTVPASSRMPGTGSRSDRIGSSSTPRGLARPGAAGVSPCGPAAAPGGHHRHPALAVVPGARDRRSPTGRRARGVRHGDEVDAAAPRERVPLPESRVQLHQPEGTVPRVLLELGLRDAVVAHGLEQAARERDGLVGPARLSDPTACRSGAASGPACGR